MDLLALQLAQKNRILDLKVKRMRIEREIYDIDQEIREKNEEIEALQNGENCGEATVVAPSLLVVQPENQKRKRSAEDEGFGSATDCDNSASKNKTTSWIQPASSASNGPSAIATPAPAVDVDSLLANLLSAGVIHSNRPENQKRKRSVEDEGFGSASDCDTTAAMKPSRIQPASSAVARTPANPTRRIHATPAPALNLDLLLADLLGSGVIHKPRVEVKPVKPSLRNPKSLRVRNPVAIAALYNGGNAKHSKDQGCAISMESKTTTQYLSVADWTKC